MAPPELSSLPVAGALDDLVRGLRERRRVVLEAPPGSGKTLLVAPAILESGLAGGGEVILLQPRRAAARAVARMIARSLGAEVGGLVGYEVRFDRRVSKETRIRVVTEGVLLARLERDPELRGAGAVVLDELHERSLEADLSLALLREVQEALRPDLVLACTSATIDAAAVGAYLGGAPVLRVEGRLHPVAVRYDPRPDDRLLPARVASAALRLVSEMERGEVPRGDVLAFLPGVRDLEAAREALRGKSDREVLLLHGRLPAEAQDRVLSGGDRPRIVLSTNLAETSVTIPGVAAVVDGGREKVSRHDRRSGLDRLEVVRISRASADQRAGRAGRLGAGTAVRLWTEVEHATLPAFADPEIRRADLAATVLHLRAWGVGDPRAFTFFEAPDPEALEAAERLLASLGAVDGPRGPLSALGRRMARVPAHPRLARFLLAASDEGLLAEAAWTAAILVDPGGDRASGAGDDGVTGSDVFDRLDRALADPSHPAAVAIGRVARQLARSVDPGAGTEARLPVPSDSLARLLLRSHPDRVGRRTDPARPELLLASGRGAVLARECRVRGDALLLALDADAGPRGAGGRALVRRASRIDPAWLEDLPDFRRDDVVRWDGDRERVVAVREERLLALVVDERPIPLADRESAAALLAAEAARDPDRAFGPSLAPGSDARALLRRIALAHEHAPEEGLPSDPRAWLLSELPALAAGLSSFADLRALPLADRLADRLPRALRRALDALVPERIEVPSGSSIRLLWPEDGPPILPVKVQEVFGLAEAPAIAKGRLPVLLHLLDPAGRPLQVTRDLASFWTRTWPEVRKAMRTRYPKHLWPEDPRAAVPSRRTTRPGGRSRS